MKEEIAKNDFYELHVDIAKNRFYYTIKGFWPNVDEVPENYNDFIKTLDKLSKGFDAIADLRQMKPPPKSVAELHVKTQTLCVERGLTRTADIVDGSLISIVIKGYDKESQRFKKAFSSIEEGEKWLDSFK